jgi:23S rRNA (pseudouridine1915-N3)-methyltransferase
MAQKLKLLAVGKPKSGFWKQAADHYRNRIGKYYALQEIHIRDAPGQLPPEERARRESAELHKKCGTQDKLICLDRAGEALTSEQFAGRLGRWLEEPGTPCFILGGAFGLDSELIQAADSSLSLSPMTLTHEMSRVLIMEQIFRAATINWGHPYHH